MSTAKVVRTKTSAKDVVCTGRSEPTTTNGLTSTLVTVSENREARVAPAATGGGEGLSHRGYLESSLLFQCSVLFVTT